MKLQTCGVTIEEILNIYGILNSSRSEDAKGITRGPFDSSLLNSDGWNGSKLHEIYIYSYGRSS
jgi:hypothetical protein